MITAAHISEHGLERLVLRTVEDAAESEQFQRHLLACAECRLRARQTPEYIRTMNVERGGSKPGEKDPK